MAQSILRYLEPDVAREIRVEHGLEAPFDFLGARTLGGPYVLDGVWRRLGVNDVLSRLVKKRGFVVQVERVSFARVAQRALAPGSTLAAESWVAARAFIDGLANVDSQQLYRAMDFLLEAPAEIQREVFWQVSNLFNLEVDVIFAGTTSTYLESEGDDDEAGGGAGGEEDRSDGLRRRGHSKDRRPDLAQAVLDFAVTRGAIPVRCWMRSGNTVDVKLVNEVKRGS